MLQVQRLALKTLLKRDWSTQMLQQVPGSFLTQVLLPALLSPVHHNTQLAANLATSGAVLEPHKQQQQDFDVTTQAGVLFASYAASADRVAVRALFSASLGVVVAAGKDLSRAGLQSGLQVLAAAAREAQQQDHGLLGDLVQTEAGECTPLTRMHIILSSLSQQTVAQQVDNPKS